MLRSQMTLWENPWSILSFYFSSSVPIGSNQLSSGFLHYHRKKKKKRTWRENKKKAILYFIFILTVHYDKNAIAHYLIKIICILYTYINKQNLGINASVYRCLSWALYRATSVSFVIIPKRSIMWRTRAVFSQYYIPNTLYKYTHCINYGIFYFKTKGRMFYTMSLYFSHSVQY